MTEAIIKIGNSTSQQQILYTASNVSYMHLQQFWIPYHRPQPCFRSYYSKVSIRMATHDWIFLKTASVHDDCYIGCWKLIWIRSSSLLFQALLPFIDTEHDHYQLGHFQLHLPSTFTSPLRCSCAWSPAMQGNGFDDLGSRSWVLVIKSDHVADLCRKPHNGCGLMQQKKIAAN